MCVYNREAALQLGVTKEYIGKKARGYSGDQATSAAHSKFVAACALNALLCEKPAWLVAEQWGASEIYSRSGVLRLYTWWFIVLVVFVWGGGRAQ